MSTVVPANLLSLSTEEKQRRGLLHTASEIQQQPATWRGSLSLFSEQRETIAAFLESADLRDPVSTRPTIFLIGAGTSDYLGHTLDALLRRKWSCETAAIASTDLLMGMENYVVAGRKYLWISFSRSGDSPESVAVLEQALERYPEIRHLVVTCNRQSRMAAIASQSSHGHAIVLDDAVNDRSLAMTSSFTNMLVIGQCLANTWSFDEYRPLCAQLQTAGEDLLVRGASLAERMTEQNFARVCFLGAGPLAGVARESALKVLEMTAGGVKTMSETVLGLRHGPMAALDADTLLVCFAPGEPSQAGYARDLLEEIGQKRIAALRIAVGPTTMQDTYASACDLYLPLSASVDDLYRPPLDVIFGQLLGIHFSVAHRMRPDAPSPAGVIRRVVQNFRIY